MDWNSLLSDDPALRFTTYTERYFPERRDGPIPADFAAKTGVKVKFGARVTTVSRDPGGLSR